MADNESRNAPAPPPVKKDHTVLAVTISGIATVAAAVSAAYVQGSMNNAGKQPVAPPAAASTTPFSFPTSMAGTASDDGKGSAGVPAAPPPADAGSVGLHQINIKNSCDKPYTIMFYYHTAAGWTAEDGAMWEYTGGENDYPGRDNKHLMTDSKEIYFYAKLKDGTGEWSGDRAVRVGDQTVSFKKAAVDEMANGDYQLEITCSDPAATDDTAGSKTPAAADGKPLIGH
ncbi:hypothetical protein [uncultured Sphingomonas sp.]|uniref:hypothetical protein n=1 Tax=uncultured Sphingomonas sp. TaxID=158754 RepID=UPI0035CB889D